MDTKSHVQEALDIGRANQRILELVTNWCRHAEVERSPFGGVGIVEAQTGLPIGFRHIRCPHMRKSSIAAMNLEAVALDFHDKNCIGCAHRNPVALPNLSEVVGERDRQQEIAEKERSKQAAREEEALQERQARRDQVAALATPAAKAFLAVVSRFDASLSTEIGEQALETLTAAPTNDACVPQAMLDLVRAGGAARTKFALRALQELRTENSLLVEAASLALSRREATRLASKLFADGLEPDTPAEIVERALFGLMDAAVPFDPPGWGSRQTTPDGLHRAAILFPSVCRSHLEYCLRSEYCGTRREALLALLELKRVAQTLIIELLPSVCSSLDRPDGDDTGRAPPSTFVSKVLSVALAIDPSKAAEVIDAEIERASASKRVALISGYSVSLRSYRFPDDSEKSSHRAAQLAAEKLVAEASRRQYDEAFEVAVDSLSDDLGPDATPAIVQACLGLLVLLAQDLRDTRRSPLDIRPPQTNDWDLEARRQRVRNGMTSIASALQSAAPAHPDLIESVESVLVQVPAADSALQYRLVSLAAGLAASPNGRRQVLPFAYRHLLDTSAVQRVAALEIYEALCKAGADDLPPLLHDTFVALMRDPLVSVHQKAVRTLRYIWSVPEAVKLKALPLVWRIATLYAEGHEDDAFLAECVTVGLNLLTKPPSAAILKFVVGALSGMAPEAAYDIIERHHTVLRSCDGFLTAVLGLLAHPGLYDSHRTELVDLLHQFPGSQLQSGQRDLVEAARQRFDDLGLHSVTVIADALSRASAWKAGAEAVQAKASSYRNDAHDARLKNAALALASSLRLEGLIAEGRMESVSIEVRDVPEMDDQSNDTIVSGSLGRGSRFVRRGTLQRISQIAHDSARRGSLRSLLHVAENGPSLASATSLRRAAETQQSILSRMGASEVATAYFVFGELMFVTTMLVQWQVAMREAEPDADRFRKAAHLRLDDLDAALATKDAPLALTALGQKVRVARGVTSALELAELCAALAAQPMPLALFCWSENTAKVATPSTPPASRSEPRTPVAVLRFLLGNEPLRDKAVVQAGVLHDLVVEVKLSRWPTEANELVIEPLTIESKDICQAPTYVFPRPENTPTTLVSTGRLHVKIPQSVGAQPLMFRYAGHFKGNSSSKVHLEGQRDLVLRSFDPSVTPITGFAQADSRLLELQEQLQQHPGLGLDETRAFMTLVTSLCAKAGMALQDAIFADCACEDDFQKKLRRYLRDDPRIGARLEEHAHVARGITDLSLDRVRLELKYSDSGPIAIDDAQKFSGQASQYVTGSDRRLGVLCILDNHRRVNAPGSIQNDVGLKVVYPSEGNGVPLILGVVVIRGNLARPSDLSR